MIVLRCVKWNRIKSIAGKNHQASPELMNHLDRSVLSHSARCLLHNAHYRPEPEWSNDAMLGNSNPGSAL